MSTIHKEIMIDAPASAVWDAVRDVGAVHQRLAPGFVTDTRLEGDARIVTFANGMVVRELIVSLDDERRRLAYAAVGGRATHHHASMQVFEDGAQRSRCVWIADVLPDTLAGPIGEMMAQGAVAMQRMLARSS